MLEPRFPGNETERLAALADYQILDTPPEPQFDRLVHIAQQLFQTPFALISLIDERRQWVKAAVGLTVEQMARAISFCGHVVSDSKSLLVLDARNDVRFYDNPLVTGAPFLRFYAGVPLCTAEGYVLGTLCVADTIPRSEFRLEQQQLLQEVADTAIDVLESRRQLNDLTQDAIHDGLTHLPNRLLFENRLQQTLFQAQREGGVVAVLRLTIDNLFVDNDNYSHAMGNRLLIGVARRLENAFRVADTVARWSGDEFTALVRLHSAAELPVVIQRLGAALSDDPAAARRVSFSAGVALYPEHGDAVGALLNAAQLALLRARETRHSCCVVAGHPDVFEFGPLHRRAQS